MSYKSKVKNMLNTYGSKVTITVGDKTTLSRAFIQPLRYKSNVYRDKSINMGGFSDGRYYLYIGQADYEFSRTDNAIISCNGKQYVVHTSETFELCDEVLYVWAVLTVYKERRLDDYEAN